MSDYLSEMRARVKEDDAAIAADSAYDSRTHYNQSLSDAHPGAYDAQGNDLMEARNPMNYLRTMRNVNSSDKGDMLSKDQSRF